MKILIVLSLLTLLAGCDRYQVTLNERAIYNPPVLYGPVSARQLKMVSFLSQNSSSV